MKSLIFGILARLTGHNSSLTPSEVIKDQMAEPRALPMGCAEFEAWSDRIISGTLLPADPDSMKFALANMLMHLGPTESHKPDAYFIHSLRKCAVNQVADAKRREIHERSKARLAAEEKARAEIEPSLALAIAGVEKAQSRTELAKK